MANWIFDRFLRQTPVRVRIISSFLLIMLLAGLISPILLLSLNSLVGRLEQVTNVDTQVERLLLTASRRVVSSQLSLSRYIQDLAPAYESLDGANQAIRDLRDAQDLTVNDEQSKSIGLTIHSLELYRQQIVDLQKANIAKNAAEVARQEIRLQQLGNDISLRLELLVDDNVKQVAASNEKALNDAQQSSRTGLTLMISGFFLALVFSALIAVSITRPLAELRKSAESFQKGDVYTIKISGADELTVIAEIFNTLTGQVGELIASLESRVSERTTELNTAVAYIKRRAKQFEAVTKVSQSISASASLHELLPYISQVVSEQFGFYHVGIFLNDPSNQYAILAAANSEGGRRMLTRGHQLKIGEQGIVGYTTGSGKPRIALNVGKDAIHFNNPDLPDTHSEMALPLKIAGKIEGALDIQSSEVNAFSDEDVEVLSALAEQVSLAIQNARLFDQTRKTLAEADAIQRQYMRETWSLMPKEEKLTGFRYSALGAAPLEKDEEIATTEKSDKHTEIAVPVALRGETIGTLTVQMPRHERINADQMDVIKAVAERVALSAENARLFAQTSRRAERERIVSDISSKIGSSVQTESILQTTAQALSALLENADIIIKLQPPQNKDAPKD
ncbi:MAG: GAF domain-containing protein [Anaerolineales bacterium]|nr:GAF domain-containing protein [Anaerolineales bacterium]